MIEENVLIEKLQRIEALFAGTTYQGERDAAAEAMKRIRARLRETQQADPPIEYRFTKLDAWSQRLLAALMRRYEIKPYRYPGQHRTTVMAKIPISFVDEILWPEFQQLNTTLRDYLDEITDRVIAEGIFHDSSEAEVVTKPHALEA